MVWLKALSTGNDVWPISGKPTATSNGRSNREDKLAGDRS